VQQRTPRHTPLVPAVTYLKSSACCPHLGCPQVRLLMTSGETVKLVVAYACIDANQRDGAEPAKRKDLQQTLKSATFATAGADAPEAAPAKIYPGVCVKAVESPRLPLAQSEQMERWNALSGERDAIASAASSRGAERRSEAASALK
jgi:hypothetical protein